MEDRMAPVSLNCIFCEVNFSSKEEMMLHLLTHNVAKPFRCLECNLSYAFKGALTRHMKIHTKEKLYLCSKCDMLFLEEQQLVQHIKVHLNKDYSCNICDFICDNKMKFDYHNKAHASHKKFMCKNCDFLSITKNTLATHHGTCIQPSSYSYECSDCSSKFRFGNALVTHAQIVHQNKKPFVCSCCNVSFSRKYNLARHMKVHTGEKAKINLGETASTNIDIEALVSQPEGKQLYNIREIVYTDKASTSFEVEPFGSTIEVQGVDNNNNICELDSDNTLLDRTEIIENKQNVCISCNKNFKLKKQWEGPVVDTRYAFYLNDYLCELALRRWQLNWNTANESRICLTCKMSLVSNRERIQTTRKSRGRPKENDVGFVTVCSKCHSEVKRTYKKHTCTFSSTKRNIKEIIENVASNNEKQSYFFSKQIPSPPIFSATADDLLLHQSVSRLSSRSMYKQTKLWKNNLQQQGFQVNIACQKKIDKLRKERVDDLFDIKLIKGNTGTEKNPIYKNISVVYCTNICELAKRIAKHRNTVLDFCKLQGDHGQGSLKLSIQFNYSNSVSSIIILAITEESKESIVTLKELEKLVNPEALQLNLGLTILRTGDLQFLQLSIGIKTGNAAYPCPFCNWRMTGEHRDAVDAVCATRDIKKDIDIFCRHGSRRDISNICHGQQDKEPAFAGVPADVFVPPCLHINLGLVNHILEKMEIKHGETYLKTELYEKAKVNKTKYQGGKFEGNEIQKIIKTFNQISWSVDHPFASYCQLFFALETTNEYLFSIKTELSDGDITNIALSIQDVTCQWECLTASLCLSKTLKLHIYAVHCLEFAMKFRCTPATFGEQDGEMLHRRFRQNLESYKTLGKKALLHAVKVWNSWSF